ncbi:hypothetical protein [Fimbriiglobus ruber]|uniref:DNA synthesis and replication n=1 Tax=Fimbriiglobus ruber TaxID=1908690 RepID=A0A225DEP4_9BACT|nr:hypothetical protein [Fimbriiglobus ruber]OWK34855.1 DNA synthesis and replication [Fimbriiglobus ruber]
MSPIARSATTLLLCVGIFSVAVAYQNADRPTPNATPATEPAPAIADGQPRWWKGNLHTHSLWSDGDDFPEMIADWYKQHGYQFLALTDHNVIAEGEKWVPADANATRKKALAKYTARYGDRWVETREKDGKNQVRLKPLPEFRSLLEEPGKYLLIPAEEITHAYAKRPIHMNGINLRDTIKPIDGRDAFETVSVNLRQVADQRARTGRMMIGFLNHPNFGWGVRAEEMLQVEELRYFEVFNGHPGVRNYGDELHASSERVWDIALALRLGKHRLPVVYGLATDDAHGYHEYGLGKVNPGRGWVMVRASHLTAESIVRGLEAGDFYASSGVLLDDVSHVGNEYRLAIRTEPGVTYKTQFVATMKDVKLDSVPKRDKDGNPLPVTEVYSADVGKVVAESTEAKPVYKLTGNELYVRAKVISAKPHPNPYAKGDMETAWTQPVRPSKAE